MPKQAVGRRRGHAIDIIAQSVSFPGVMKRVVSKALTLAFMGLGVASVLHAQQRDPRDILPPTPQRPVVSPTLTIVAPGSVAEPSPGRITLTPQAPAPPAQSTPAVSLPGTVGTNTVEAPGNGQQSPSVSAQPSAWGRTNTAQTSAWEKTSGSPLTLAPAQKPSSDPWSAPASTSPGWDSKTPLGASGTKTEWK
jgi:hypothetical protein